MTATEDGATVRQRIIEALKGRLLSAKDISKTVGIREKEVIEHLPHCAKTAGRSHRFVVEPSRCLGCGFVFRKRGRLRTPSKCPVCASEHITEARYGIQE